MQVFLFVGFFVVVTVAEQTTLRSSPHWLRDCAPLTVGTLARRFSICNGVADIVDSTDVSQRYHFMVQWGWGGKYDCSVFASGR